MTSISHQTNEPNSVQTSVSNLQGPPGLPDSQPRVTEKQQITGVPSTLKTKHYTHKTDKPLSTNSPAAIAAASQVTPDKLSQLLLEMGPLAIRHITSNLAEVIPSFDKLSASKQRRLIMSALESGDQEKSVIFEKIGWGQWSAKKVDPERFRELRDLTNLQNAQLKDSDDFKSLRRDSITHHAAPRKNSITSPRLKVEPMEYDDVFDSDDEDDDIMGEGTKRHVDAMHEDLLSDADGDDEALIPSLKLSAQRISPPAGPGRQRRPSKGIIKPGIARRRFSSNDVDERARSFSKESSMRSTLSPVLKPALISALLTKRSSENVVIDNHSETDDEDWESIGALSLRNNSAVNIDQVMSSHEGNDDREGEAAMLLMQLGSKA